MSDQGSCQDQPNWLTETRDLIDEAAYYSSMVDELRFEASQFSLQQLNTNNDGTTSVAATGSEKGQSSGTRRDEFEEGVREDSGTSDRTKQRKRGRSAELHNQNERLRRLRLKEKLKALQELIPNCNKRDKSSTFDDAIHYIKTLQYQNQVMSMRAGYAAFNMMPQPGLQGMLIPSHTPLLQTPSIGIKYGSGAETGTATGIRMPTTSDFPVGQAGLPNPWLLPYSTALKLPAPLGISAATMGLGLESQRSISPTEDPITESRARRESMTATTRVLPSKIVQRKEVVD